MDPATIASAGTELLQSLSHAQDAAAALGAIASLLAIALAAVWWTARTDRKESWRKVEALAESLAEAEEAHRLSLQTFRNEIRAGLTENRATIETMAGASQRLAERVIEVFSRGPS